MLSQRQRDADTGREVAEKRSRKRDDGNGLQGVGEEAVRDIVQVHRYWKKHRKRKKN